MEGAGDPPTWAAQRNIPRKRSRPAEGKDLISALPDSLMLHVFSFLDVKDVVKTSVLSKRWSSLWNQTSAISIDFRNVRCAIDDKISYFDRFLLLCTSPAIHKFHLRGLNEPVGMKDRFDLWIRFAVGRGVEDLYINVFFDVYVLPRALLLCESLKSLRLSSCGFPSFANSNLRMIRWNLLRVLSVHCSYMPDEVINGVLEGSPQLESLTLDTCYGMNSIRILSRTMSELVISRYHVPHEDLRDGEDENRGHTNLCLEIFAPYLRTLRLLDNWDRKEVIVLKQASSLVEVELDFNLTLCTNQDIIYDTMKGICSELHCVDKLIIGNAALKVLHNCRGDKDFSLQLKCRHLTITTFANEYCFRRIAGVLECAPNVETLVIDFAPKICPGGFCWQADPFCKKESLKTGRIRSIEITGFPVGFGPYGVKPEYCLFLIKVLLRDAQVLEKMVIDAKWAWRFPERGLEEESQAQDVLEVEGDILGCPRGSKAAKIILNYPFNRKESSVVLT